MQKPSQKSLRSLDALNVFLADVRDGVGPYLGVYLKAAQNWNPAQIGMAISASTIATVIAQTPAGALVDRLHQKKLLIGLAAVLVSVGCISMALFPSFPVVIGAQILIGIGAAVFPPAIAAITLGLVGRDKLDRRIGRNETFNHAGNLIAAGLAAVIGQFVAQKGIFFLVAAMTIGSGISVARIRGQEIDHDVARGAEDGEESKSGKSSYSLAGLLRILRDRRIRFITLSVVLFHFANAAMLPLVGQRLAANQQGLDPTVYMSACIIVAQLVMIPTANWTGRLTQSGRKPLFLLGFAVLPIRGVLYTLSSNPYFLVSVQILDLLRESRTEGDFRIDNCRN